MAADFPLWKKAIVERSTNYLDRRISAVLFRDGIELYRKGLHHPILEAYNTAAVWNIVAPHVGKRRLHPAVYHLNCAHSLCIDDGLTPEELRLLTHPESFVERKRNLPVATLRAIRPKWFRSSNAIS